MAEYPCDHHNARYAGPSVRAYLNLYREEEKIQLKGSVCGDCLAELVEGWLSWALYQTPDGWTFPDDEPAKLEDLWMPVSEAVEALRGSRRWNRAS